LAARNHCPVAVRADRSDQRLAATSQKPAPTHLLAIYARSVRAGVIVVIMAYITRVPRSMWPGHVAYVSGGVGRIFWDDTSRELCHNFAWREAFIADRAGDLAGAIVVQRSRPRRSALCVRLACAFHHRGLAASAKSAPARSLRHGFAALFCCRNIYLRQLLSCQPRVSAELTATGSVFFAYLLGLIVTPLSGRWLDHYGIRLTSFIGVAHLAGLLLTLMHSLPVIIRDWRWRRRSLHYQAGRNGADRQGRRPSAVVAADCM